MPAKVYMFAPWNQAEEKRRQVEEENRRKLEQAGCELTFGDPAWVTSAPDEGQVAVQAAGADALVGTSVRGSGITRRVMEASPNLRIVAKYTIGVDDVDTDAATELGILVTHGPTESNWGGVAETTMGFMISMLKRFPQRDAHMKAGGWRSDHLMGTYLGKRIDGYEGITVGIVGMGRIGSRVADMLRPWRMRVIGYDPYVPRDRWALTGVQTVDYQTLLRESDVVSFHVVLTKETRHMLGATELALMKPTAVVVNTSRGPVIDEKALAEALDKNVIAGAALDVFEEEPLPPSSPLRELGDKVMLSPHMASNNIGGGLEPGVIWATESVLAALRGRVPDNVYNKDVIPAWLQRFGGKSAL